MLIDALMFLDQLLNLKIQANYYLLLLFNGVPKEGHFGTTDYCCYGDITIRWNEREPADANTIIQNCKSFSRLNLLSVRESFTHFAKCKTAINTL